MGKVGGKGEVDGEGKGMGGALFPTPYAWARVRHTAVPVYVLGGINRI